MNGNCSDCMSEVGDLGFAVEMDGGCVLIGECNAL